MRDVRGIAKLLIVAVLVAFGLTLWAAGRASANCMANEPNCMSDPTSPPYTSPPDDEPSGGSPSVTSNQKSSSGGSHTTSPPINRNVPATSRRPTPTQPRVNRAPVAAAAEDFVPLPAEATVIQPGPAIALVGDAPAGGAGTAANVGLPPAAPKDGGAGTVLWGFGIGAGAVGVALGTRTLWSPTRQLDIGLDVVYSRLNP